MSILGTIMSKVLGKAPASPAAAAPATPSAQASGTTNAAPSAPLRLHRRRRWGHQWMSPQCSTP